MKLMHWTMKPARILLLGGLVGACFPPTSAQVICDPQGIVTNDGMVRAAAPVREVVPDLSRPGSGWEISGNCCDLIRFEWRPIAGRDALVLTNREQKKGDTAFELKIGPIQVADPVCYDVSLKTASDFAIPFMNGFQGKYRNRFIFYDAAGKRIGLSPFSLITSGSRKFEAHGVRGKFPAGVASFELFFGMDRPNIPPDRYFAIADLRIRWQESSGEWVRESGFTSGVFPVTDSGPARLSWRLSGSGAWARFQVATAEDRRGFPGAFSAFHGPDGSEDSWFTVNGSTLPDWKKPVRLIRRGGRAGVRLRHPRREEPSGWIRYRVRLHSGDEAPAALESVVVAGNIDSGWRTIFDCEPPRVVRVSESPTLEAGRPFAVRLEDESGIDWATLKVALDGEEATARVVRAGKGFAIAPEREFAPGVHSVRIGLADLNGNRTDVVRFFRIGAKAERGYVTLRDDGMALIDGRPFFPIGMYGLARQPIHHDSFDQAFAALKEIGVNLVHSYRWRYWKSDREFQEFMDAARKHGMMLWLGSRGRADANDDDLKRIADTLVNHHLDNPNLLAWYVGDDTHQNNRPEQLRERTDLVRALAPRLITVHSDGVGSDDDDHYRPFADSTLAFLPQIYPILRRRRADAEACVAQVICDMRLILRDIRELKIVPRSIWPAIQCFQGWGWERFPTPLELRAMSFAAIVSGSHGIVWYTYASHQRGQGVSFSKEIWDGFAAVAREIAGYAPVFAERAAERQIQPIVVSGPGVNVRQTPSVIALTKRHEGRTYVFAVNSVMEKVGVEMDVSGFAAGRWLGLDRTAEIVDGIVAAEFAPYAVRILELK